MKRAFLWALVGCSGGGDPSFEGVFAGQVTVSITPTPATDSGVYFYDTTLTLADDGMAVEGTVHATSTNPRVVSPIDGVFSATKDGATLSTVTIRLPVIASGCNELTTTGTGSYVDSGEGSIAWTSMGTFICNAMTITASVRPSASPLPRLVR